MRRTRTAFLEIGRKNGKSELCAALALYMLIADGEESPEVYGAACDRDQASLVFNVAAQMVARNEYLRSRTKTIHSTKRIICTANNGVYRAIPADAGGAMGYNSSCNVVDELHVQKDRHLLDALTTSMGARQQPLTIAITTAGFDRSSICYELYDYARKVNKGTIRDRTFVGHIYELPDGTDFETVAADESLWKLANPSLESEDGGWLRYEDLRLEFERATHMPQAQNTVMRLHMNTWTQAESRWFSRGGWDACGGIIVEDRLKSKPCFAGLDLGSTSDFTALALVFPRDGDTGDGYDLVMRFWLPEAAFDKQTYSGMRDQLDEWRREGALIVTPGDVLDYRAVQSEVEKLAAYYDVREIGFDPWHATQLAVELGESLGEDIMVPVRQGFRTLSAPSKMLETLVGRGIDGLNHGGHPVLRWMADNVVAEVNADEGLKPSKQKSTQRIDGIAALVTALERAMVAEEPAAISFVAFD